MTSWLESFSTFSVAGIWKPGNSLSPGIPLIAADSVLLTLLTISALSPSCTVMSEANCRLSRMGLPSLVLPESD